MATNGGSCWSRLQQPLQTRGSTCRSSRPRCRRPHAAHVVQRVGREDGDRPAVRLAQGEDRHRRVGRTGRLDQVRAARRRIHLHLVDAAERIGRHRARLHEPAAVEDVLRRLGRAERRPAPGAARFTRALHAVGDPPGDERLVSSADSSTWRNSSGSGPARCTPSGCATAEISTCSGGMPVVLLDQLAGLDAHVAVDAQQIADDQRPAGSCRRPAPGSGRAARRGRGWPERARSRR